MEVVVPACVARSILRRSIRKIVDILRVENQVLSVFAI